MSPLENISKALQAAAHPTEMSAEKMPLSPLPLTDPNWTLEWLKIAQGLFGTLVGGGLVLLGGWLADRRKQQNEYFERDQREKAIMTGMFAVRNHIVLKLNEYEVHGTISGLEPLRTAQSYVHRLIEKAPGESESLMITIIEIGLKIDTLIATMDRRLTDPSLKDPIALAAVVTREVDELNAALEQFDIISTGELPFMSEKELSQFSGYSEESADAPTSFSKL